MSTQALEERLDAIRAAGGFRAAAIDRLRTYLQSAVDEELFRASPLRFATDYDLAEQEAISLFLHATYAGVLEFAWGFLCPACVAFLTTAGGLRSLQEGKRCNFCNKDVVGPIGDEVEVGFTVSPAVRRIRFHSPDTLDLRRDAITVFFSSSIAPSSPLRRRFNEELIFAGRAEPDAVQEEVVTVRPDRHVLIIPTNHAVMWLDVREGAEAKAVDVDVLDDRTVPGEVVVSPGEVRLRIRNRTTRPVAYMFLPSMCKDDPVLHEHVSQHKASVRPYLTGPRLIASQAFRELFRAESIPSEGGLELKSLTVLFTDLKGSTAIYERVGDLQAYDLVRKHFALLRSIVAERGGAIVKTIGDAVMASFAEPVSAMQAAAAMRREVEKIGQGDLLLKIGLHTGRCIAVELNDRLDYFGRTVNIAARVQGVADAGEIVCTDEVWRAPGVGDAVSVAGLSARQAEVPLKGIDGAVPVIRLR
jgi:class 3 adenylate cyclase